MNNSKNVAGAVILALASGAAIGATLGILFAPNKGTVTRKRIASRGEYAARTVKEKMDDLKDSMTEIFEEMEDKAAIQKEMHKK